MFKFSLFGVPIAVEGWFWLTAVLLSGGVGAHDAEDWMVVVVRMGVIFISIVVHELGHAFAGRHYGASPFIRLHGFGGVTFLPGARFSRGENILVSAAGPAAGLLLGLVILGVNRWMSDLPMLARAAVVYGLYVNFVWTFLNLLPIPPLDGGQILRDVLGPRRAALTSGIGLVLAVLLCIWAVTNGMIFSAVMLAMLAYYNFQRQPVEGGVVTGRD
jgi:Zn-dependent protease